MTSDLQQTVSYAGGLDDEEVSWIYGLTAEDCDGRLEGWLRWLDSHSEVTDTSHLLARVLLLLDRKAELQAEEHQDQEQEWGLKFQKEVRDHHTLQEAVFQHLREEKKTNSLLREELQQLREKPMQVQKQLEGLKQNLQEERQANSCLREELGQLQHMHKQALQELDSNCVKERRAREQLREANSALQAQLQRLQDEHSQAQRQLELERQQQRHAHSLLQEELQQLQDEISRVQHDEKATQSPPWPVKDGTKTDEATQTPSVEEPTEADAPASGQSTLHHERVWDKPMSRCRERRRTPAQRPRKQSTDQGGSSGYESSASDHSPCRSISSAVSINTETAYGASRPRLEHRHGRRTPPQQVKKQPKPARPRDCQSLRTCQLESTAQQVRRFDPRKAEPSITSYLQQVEHCLMNLPHPTRREKLNLVWNTTTPSVHRFIVTLPPKVRGHYQRLCQALCEKYARNAELPPTKPGGKMRPQPQQPSSQPCNQDSRKKRSPAMKTKAQNNPNIREKDEISQLLQLVQKLIGRIEAQ